MSVYTSKSNSNDKWLTTHIAKSIAGDNSCHSPIKERHKQGILLVPWLNDDRSATRTPTNQSANRACCAAGRITYESITHTKYIPAFALEEKKVKKDKTHMR